MPNARTVSLSRTIVVSVLAASALGGCAGYSRPLTTAGPIFVPHPIEVAVTKLRHPVRLDGAVIPPAEWASLDSFLARSDLRPGDEATILFAGGPAETQAAGDVAAHLHGSGVTLRLAADGRQGPGGLEVVIERYVASVADCPNWTRSPSGDPSNSTSGGFGCAAQSNLAAMVVDAHDLVAGRAPGPVVGDPAARPIGRYREGLTPALGATAPAGATPAPSPAGGAAGAPPGGA